MKNSDRQTGTHWYLINNTDELDTPALVVYPQRVKDNIRRMIEMTGDPARLRPHVKTHKSPAVTILMLEAGIRQFKCATIAEAEMLAECGAPDVLLAYQPVGPKILRLVNLINKYPQTRFSCLTDNMDAAAIMAAVFAGHDCEVPVYIDLNVGMNRTGIAAGEAAIELYLHCRQLTGIVPVGLHAYDGHIREVDFAKRKAACDEAFKVVEGMKAALMKELSEVAVATAVPIIIAGGSPTFSIHCKRPGVICSPGTSVYWDKGYSDGCPEQPFEPAALVVTRVISLPEPTRICLDLGHKSIAAESELSRRVSLLNGPDLKPIGQSEEHLVMNVQQGHSYRPGDIFYGLPFHICPTVALFERAYIVEDGKVSGWWLNEARDRKITI